MSLRKPLLVGITLILLLVGTLIRPNIVPAAAQTQSLTFNPVADAYVNSASPLTNYGSATTLRADASPSINSYLRFSISGLSGSQVSQARLKIFANTATSQSLAVRSVANDTWSEGSLNYSNAPLMGGTLAAAPSVSAGAWVIIDVTQYITGNGLYSLGLATSGSTAVSLASREAGVNAPQLVLTLSGSIAPTPTQLPPADGSGNILLLAGDICKHDLSATDYTPNCKKTGDLVRSVLAANPGAQVQTLGDNVNNDTGTSSYDSEYKDLYAPNWGSFLSVTHALMGNHDTYAPGGTDPYFAYFGAKAGPKPGGYYSYNFNSSWHVIVLNAQCSKAGGCGVGTPQYNWLKNDLAANTKKCVLAVWHQPRWTSGRHSDNSAYAPWWSLLYQYKADIIAGGHNHNYERFNLIDPNEKAASDGIREFIVGTGGAPGDAYTYASHPLDPNEAIRNQTQVYGVLKLTLSTGSYSWKFLPASGYTFTDTGSTACH
jgi:hypothetical protein